MSLLDRSRETITVYPEMATTDRDGNTITKASPTGIEAPAVIQPSAQSGTSARRAEQDNEGFESEENYRVRFPRNHVFSTTQPLGPQSKIEWRGSMWSLVGYPTRYNSSSRTAHIDYTIRRT